LPFANQPRKLRRMSERRYNDEEVDAIFRIASDERSLVERQAPNEHGLTLGDLQAIARDVGIAPDAVARAAVAVDVQTQPSRRTYFGLPIGVGRTVELNRKMSDEEWERFVVQLREVFHARGSTRRDGTLRQWTNGNLHVLVEPTANGHRLRFGTYNGQARASISMGVVALGITAVTMIATAISGTLVHAVPGVAFLGIAGLGMIASGAARLPRWARLRGRQMEQLAADVASSPPTLTRGAETE
jgi:hypothetical protein